MDGGICGPCRTSPGMADILRIGGPVLLVTAGLADDQVCIGDRYRIGAAVFEVTQPRVTCYRAGIRMGDPRIPAPRGPNDVEGRDYQTEGRLSASVLAALDLPRDAQAYICGPAAFMADVSAVLAEMGIDRVRTEIFGAAPAQTPGIAAFPARPPHPPPGAPGEGRRSRSPAAA